jgi:hypothetical protein
MTLIHVIFSLFSVCLLGNLMDPDNYFEFKTGDLFDHTQSARRVKYYENRFKEILYVKRMTSKEARLAHKEKYDFVVTEETGSLNLSVSDDEPSKEKFL